MVPVAAAAPGVLERDLGNLGTTQVRVPFSLQGTLDNPRFTLAGTPQLVTAQGPSPAAPPGTTSATHELLKLIPGL